MEDAHIATVNLGNAPDAAIFGVFDGHGGRCYWVSHTITMQCP